MEIKNLTNKGDMSMSRLFVCYFHGDNIHDENYFAGINKVFKVKELETEELKQWILVEGEKEQILNELEFLYCEFSLKEKGYLRVYDKPASIGQTQKELGTPLYEASHEGVFEYDPSWDEPEEDDDI